MIPFLLSHLQDEILRLRQLLNLFHCSASATVDDIVVSLPNKGFLLEEEN